MITIDYRRDYYATLIPDWCAEEHANALLTSTDNGKLDFRVTTGSENYVHAFRALIAEGVIPLENIKFLFDGTPVTVNKYGVCLDWPRGWCDNGDNIALRILSAAMKTRRAEKESEWLGK